METKIISIICIVLLTIIAIYFFARYVYLCIVPQKRAERISFLRGFKKGNCAYIYLIAVPLYLIGYYKSGKSLGISFFLSVKEIINLVVLKYETKAIEALLAECFIYKVAVYYTFILVFINAIIFAISIFGQHLHYAFEIVKFRLSLKERVVIFGNNKENLTIYYSDTKKHKIILDKFKDKEDEALYVKKVAYMSINNKKSTIKTLFEWAKKSKKNFYFIINTGSDDENIKICRRIIKELDTCKIEDKENLYLHFRAYVFGDPKYTAIFEDIVSSAYGCITYHNKYQKIAMDFVDKYPISKFLTPKQVDYKTSLVKSGVDINVLLIGFGKTNQQVFLTSVANNQFLTEPEKPNGEPKFKKVNYFIFDKEKSENNKNLNHTYYRYFLEKDNFKQEDYLEFPNEPAKETYLTLDVNDNKFYKQIKDICIKNPNSKNFVVIAFGKDLENIDMAQKLIEKRQEWKLDFVVLAKANNYILEETLLNEEDCYLFGNNKEITYNLDNIISDKIYSMAKQRNFVYDLEHALSVKPNCEALTEKEVYEVWKSAEKKWHKNKTQLERDSSCYACLSIKSKLNLIGLDYVEKEKEGKALTDKQYYKKYDENNEIRDTKIFVDGKKVLSYDLKFPTTLRGILARHEHLRWNSYMISRGIVPASKEQILNEKIIVNGEERYTNGKNYKLRKHGNLTTFDGLVEFRKMISKRDGLPEEKTDVIKYDYQLLDDAFWLLDKNGYKIIEKQ